MMNAEITSRTACRHDQPVSVHMHCTECTAAEFRVVRADALAVSLTDDQRAALVHMLRHQAPAIEKFEPVLGGAMRSLLAQLT